MKKLTDEEKKKLGTIEIKGTEDVDTEYFMELLSLKGSDLSISYNADNELWKVVSGNTLIPVYPGHAPYYDGKKITLGSGSDIKSVIASFNRNVAGQIVKIRKGVNIFEVNMLTLDEMKKYVVKGEK